MKKLILLSTICVLIACSGDPINDEPGKPNPQPNPNPDITTYSVNGNVQKGPFTQGTSITIQALDESLNPTGASYQTKTSDDAGTFKINNKIESRYVEIIATGYYFNEISGRISNSTITLRSLSDLTEKGNTNVNILTTLEADRIRSLVISGGLSLTQAREQAERELFDIFHIPNAVSASEGFDKMDITKQGEANAILLAISTTLQGKRSEGELSELISKIASEIEIYGEIQNDIIAEQIREGGMTVNAEKVRANLETRYNTLGITDYEIPPFEDYLDVNGNGIIDKQDNWLILSEKDFMLSDEGGTIEIELKHNIDYDITIEDGGDQWIIHNTTRGYLETDNLIFTVQKNETYDARYARIAVKDRSSSYTEYITVSQKQLDALTVTSDRFEVGKSGGIIDIEIKANVSFDVEIPAPYNSWINQVPVTRGLAESILQFNIAQNDEPDVRKGKIIIKSGNLSEEITVYQTGEKVLILNQKEYTVSDQGSIINVEVTSNIDYEIIMPPVNWISETQKTRGIITNTRSFTIASNPTYDAREAEIIFRDINSNLQEKVIVYQTQKDAIIVAKNSYNFDNDGGNLALTIQANVDVDVEIPETSKDWITQAPQTRTLTERVLNFIVAANEGYDKREGAIIVKNIQKNLSDTIKIYQAQKNAIILTQNEYSIPNEGGNFTVEVRSNIDFSVYVDGGEWLRQVATRGLTSHTLNFIADANTTYDTRNAVITITNTANNLKESINVYQNQKNAIIIGSNEFEVPYSGGDVKVEIKSNIDYEVVIADNLDWITKAPNTRGLTVSIVTLRISKNENIEDRIGKVTIQDTASGISNTVTITQAGNTEVQTINVAEAGTLGSILSEIQKANLVNIKITGSINKDDFKTLEKMPKLAELDLSEAGVVGNTIPAEAMCTIGSIGTLQTYKSESNLQKLILPEGVTVISENAFAAMKKLKEVTLPSSLTAIREAAFCLCSDLQSIDIPDNVTIIGKLAFSNCYSLQAVNFTPNSRLQRIESVMGGDGIGNTVTEGSFSYCSSLTRFEVPASVTVIGAGAFNDCTALEELVIPSNTSLTKLTGYVYRDEYVLGSKQQTAGIVEGCMSLKTLRIPANIRLINNYAFANCGIETVIFEEGSLCTKLGDAVFANCPYLKNIEIPQSVKVLGNCVFINCESLESLDLSQFTSVGKTLISGCQSLTSIVLPNYMTELSAGFFSGCTSIESCILPESINKIGANAFKDCSNLKAIDIPESVTEIGSKAFAGCTSLTSIIIPSKVNNLGEEHSSTYTAGYVFEGCTNLREFSLSGNSRIEFYGNTFSDCTSLTTVNLNAKEIAFHSNEFENTPIMQIKISSITESFSGFEGISSGISEPWKDSNVNEFIFEAPSNLRRIGRYAFAGSNISNITLPETVTELSEGIFANCTSLIDWEIPAHIKKLTGGPYYKSNISNPRLNSNTRLEYVGDYAFNGIHGMTSADISSATYVGRSVFGGCYDLQHVVLPEYMTEIPYGMFMECSLLQTIELPASVKKIDYYAFQGCSSLTNINTSNIEKLQDRAFEDCMMLQHIDLSHASEIGDACFANCSSLESIKLLNEGELYIGGCAFYGCQALRSITIPANITKFSGGYNGGVGAKFEGGTFTGTNAEIILEPNSQLQTLCGWAFAGSNTLEEITLPNVIEFTSGPAINTQGYMFSGCPNLKRISFPSIVSVIRCAYGNFEKCPSLETIDIPKAQDIDMDFFNYITSPVFTAILPETLKVVYNLDDFKPQFGEVICNAITPPTIEGYGPTNIINCTLRVPATCVEIYKADPNWSKFATILPIE